MVKVFAPGGAGLQGGVKFFSLPRAVLTTRETLELQLLDNLLALAKLCKVQPEKAAEFIYQSLLEDPQHVTVPPNPA